MNERTTELTDRLDSLVMENVELKERSEVAEKKIEHCENQAQRATEKGNYNEQYSR